MRITELLDIRSIALDAAPKSKQETLDAAVALMVKSGKITDEDAYRAQVYAREEESTTGIGEGIAIPHGKCDAVNKPGLAAMVIPNGVDFDSLDGEPVTLLFLIAAPNTKDNVHLDVLSKLSMMLMDEEFTKSLRNARTPEEFLAIIDRADEEKKSVDERLAEPVEAKENQVKILAVTSCPTGIAHTYMAAEGIEKAAKAKGCFVKVETRGSGGAKNVLTAQEIADANPNFEKDSLENYLYFTLPMALNYQRNSYTLWESALKTYNDEGTRFVFNPKACLEKSFEEVQYALTKYKVALQKQKQTEIWLALCNTFVEMFDGDIRKLFDELDNDVDKIRNFIQKENKKKFPYLSGTKICNYWMYVIYQYTDRRYKNIECLTVAPDTHVCKATHRLGLITDDEFNSSNVQQIVIDRWQELFKGTKYKPIDIHTQLWLCSRNGFKEVK